MRAVIRAYPSRASGVLPWVAAFSRLSQKKTPSGEGAPKPGQFVNSPGTTIDGKKPSSSFYKLFENRSLVKCARNCGPLQTQLSLIAKAVYDQPLSVSTPGVSSLAFGMDGNELLTPWSVAPLAVGRNCTR